MTAATAQAASVGAWRHVRAIALLPFMNLVAIPSLLLALSPPQPIWSAAAWAAFLVAGAALALCGGALVAHSIGLFVRLGRGTLAPWDPTQQLVVAGAYRYTRNPMKAGLFLVLAGEAIAMQSTALTAWLACFAIVNLVYIRWHEEPRLAARFGDAYRAYCARVPRWWPTLRSLRSRTADDTTS